jgi:cytochrome P450
MLLFTDPPAHTRLRALMTEAIDPELLHGIVGEIPGIVDGLLDDLEAGDEPDVMADFAVPLPVLVMARLLGIPAGDLPRFKAWSRDIVSFADVRRQEGVPDGAARATRELADHLREVLARRREDPGDDLLSQLVTARLDGDGLADGELLANAVLLVCAGHETTVNLIGNGLHALLRHPDQLRRVRGSGRLDDRAVDELLRFDSPVQMTFRVARSDVEIGGVHVAAGDTVAAVLGAANRDPRAFPGPDRLDLRRSGRPHLAFGGGPHHCLGSHLGKLEARIALGRLLRRFPDASLPDGWEPSWSDTVLFRGLRSLPVEPG